MIGQDDYPWPHANPADLDQWGYNFRNCTSFVAWRIENDLRLPVPRWGNGGEFAAKAAGQGVLVDSHPRPGTLACFLPNQNGAGPVGHIAFVMSLSTGAGKVLVNLEEYNFLEPFAYGQRLDINPAGLRFIHYAKESPQPSPDPQPPPLPQEEDVAAVVIRSAGSVDPAGAGAVYLVRDPVYGPKRHITANGDLAGYLRACGQAAPKVIDAYVLDRMQRGPDIDNSITSPPEV